MQAVTAVFTRFVQPVPLGIRWLIAAILVCFLSLSVSQPHSTGSLSSEELSADASLLARDVSESEESFSDSNPLLDVLLEGLVIDRANLQSQVSPLEQFRSASSVSFSSGSPRSPPQRA